MVEERAIQSVESEIAPLYKGRIPSSLTDEEVASTGAKQSSRGRGTTEYENRLAPRGAGGQSICLREHYQRLLILFTCKDLSA